MQHSQSPIEAENGSMMTLTILRMSGFRQYYFCAVWIVFQPDHKSRGLRRVSTSKHLSLSAAPVFRAPPHRGRFLDTG